MQLHDTEPAPEHGQLTATSDLEPAPPIFGVLSRALTELRNIVDTHPIWQCELLRACAKGQLSREDFAFLFSQYYEYSKSFTRYLSAAMTNCEDELLRSRLTQNLWEEGGGADPSQRHSLLFRKFLSEGLDVSVSAIVPRDFSKMFAQQYLEFCSRASSTASSAFLSLGTEAIVPRLYRIFRDGLRSAGVAGEHLLFFDVHIAGDDDHAATLLEMMCSRGGEPGWRETCEAACRRALDLRLQFFEAIMESLSSDRVQHLVDRLRPDVFAPQRDSLLHKPTQNGVPLYYNQEGKIDFTVERLPFKGEVLDPRIVRVPSGKTNELHRHAHETVIHVMSGRARVRIDQQYFEADPGDTVFVPRWCMHQAESIGLSDLVYFAVTDFGFASRGYNGDYLEGHRQQRDHDQSFGR